MKNIKPPKISLSKNRLSSKKNPLETGAHLAEQRLKGDIEYTDPSNNLIGEIAGQLHEGFRGQKNDLDSIASGFFKGIQNVTKFNKMFENDKKYQEYQKVMDYFQEVNNQKVIQQQYHDKMEQAQEKLRPEALAYFQNTRKDPQTADISGRNMWDKYKELTGETGEWRGWTPMDQNIAMIEDEDGVHLIDIRPLLLGDQYTENEIATLGQDYQNRLQEERQRYDQEMALENRKVRSGEALNQKRMGVYDAQINKLNNEPFSAEVNGEGDEVPLARMGKKFADEWQKTAVKEISQIPINERAIGTVQEMKEVFNAYPEIGSSFLNLIVNDGNINGWFNTISRRFANQGELAAAEKLKKLSNDLNLSTVMGIQGKAATDILKQAIAAASPSGRLTKEAFNSIAESWENRAEHNIKRAQLIEDSLSRGMYPRNLEGNLRSVPLQIPPQQTQTPLSPQNDSYIIEDENGEKIQVTPEQYNLLMNQV